MTQPSRTESVIVATQYNTWVYPQPVPDMAKAVQHDGYYDLSDPSLFRRKLWPKNVEPDHLDILIAGCGANQAAYYAFANPNSQIVAIDVSESALGHQAYLKQKHHLDNLELFHMNLGRITSLGRSFDLIVSTGVLHHLPDPDAGLRSLRDVLKPHGVISGMIYGYYSRFGVYMMQEAFRVLGTKQDVAGIELVKNTIQILPAWHHVHSYMKSAPDLGYDSGLVDTFLHPLDRAYTVPQVIEFASRNNLKFQSWTDNLDYSITACIEDNKNLVRRHIEALPLADQWHLVEIIAQSLATHRFLFCHSGKSEETYMLDFSGEDWLDYVPSLRRPIELPNKTDAVGTAQTSADGPGTSQNLLPRLLKALPGGWRSQRESAPATDVPSTIRRRWHASDLTAFEADLLEQVNGERSVRETMGSWPTSMQDQQSSSAARDFFRRMADWDHLQYQIP